MSTDKSPESSAAADLRTLYADLRMTTSPNEHRPDIVFGGIESLRVAPNGGELFRIMPNGEVQIPDGVQLNDATRAFWDAVGMTRAEHRLPATLSTVKPGGMVRLGDQTERARFEAYFNAFNLDKDADGSYLREMIQDKWEDWQVAWRASLSVQHSPGGHFDLEAMLTACIPGGSIVDPQLIADNIRAWFGRQPSPGGQGDASHYWPEVDRILVDAYAAGSEGDEFDMIAARNAISAALAARQPVGEPVGFQIMRKAWNKNKFNGRWESPPQDFANNRQYFAGRPGDYRVRDIYAAPPAHAVDLGPSIPSELVPVAAALKRFNECAEDSGSDGCDIGRDWFDALTTMGLLKRTQRSPAVWTMTAEGDRLLALIDSQAVGK